MSYVSHPRRGKSNRSGFTLCQRQLIRSDHMTAGLGSSRLRWKCAARTRNWLTWSGNSPTSGALNMVTRMNVVFRPTCHQSFRKLFFVIPLDSGKFFGIDSILERYFVLRSSPIMGNICCCRKYMYCLAWWANGCSSYCNNCCAPTAKVEFGQQVRKSVDSSDLLNRSTIQQIWLMLVGSSITMVIEHSCQRH